MDKYRAQALREKSVKEGLTLEEMKEVVLGLRKDRVSACFASKGAKSKKSKELTADKEHMEEDLFASLTSPTEKGDDDDQLQLEL